MPESNEPIHETCQAASHQLDDPILVGLQQLQDAVEHLRGIPDPTLQEAVDTHRRHIAQAPSHQLNNSILTDIRDLREAVEHLRSGLVR